MFLTTTLLLCAQPISLPPCSSGDDWPGWRGAGGNGVATGSPPLEWSEDVNVRWKVAIPGKGLSSPVVLGEQIFLTTAVPTAPAKPEGSTESEEAGDTPTRAEEPQGRPGRGGGRGPGGGRGGFMTKTAPSEHDYLVLSVDRQSGDINWSSKALTHTPHEGTHGDSSFATPTLVTDGERLFVSFGSAGVFAYDLEGKQLWKTDLGDMQVQGQFGEGSSPVLADDKLILLWQHNGESFLTALNTSDGEPAWRVSRPEGTSWTTPTVAGNTIIVPSTAQTLAYSASDGSVLWTYGESAPAPEPREDSEQRPERGERGGRGGFQGRGGPGGRSRSGLKGSAVVADDVVYFSTGGRRGQGGQFLALHIDKVEDEGEAANQLAWRTETDVPDVPSPVVIDGTLFGLKGNGGQLTAVDAKSGKVLYSGERMEALGNTYASPVAAAGYLIFSGRDGVFEVVEAAKEFKTVHVNTLDDHFDASPAVVGDTLILRGLDNLYCIAKEE